MATEHTETATRPDPVTYYCGACKANHLAVARVLDAVAAILRGTGDVSDREAAADRLNGQAEELREMVR